MMLCITGMPGSGKSEVGAMLVEKGFTEVEMSASIRERMREQGIEVDNVSIREFSVRVRKEYGGDIVSRWTMESVRKLRSDRVLIVGIRSVDEAEYFETQGELMIVLVTAPEEVRFERLKARGRSDDPKTRADFDYREEKERQFGMGGIMGRAQYVISNAGTVDQLRMDVGALLERMEAGE